MRFLRAVLAMVMLAVFFNPVGAAAAPGAAAPEDPVFQERLRKLEEELRCLVCQNQSLADSHAELAGDLRREVRGLAEQGKSDEEIVAFLKTRYGDFVTYRPPFNKTTGLLWLGPLLFLLGALGAVVMYTRRRRSEAENPVALSAEEQKRAHALLGLEQEK